MESIKCPGCNANLEYSIEDEKLQCKYCGTISNIEEEKNVDIDILEERMIEVNEAICPDCGAKLMTDTNTMSAKCTYCGSSLIYNQNIKAFSPKKILLFEKGIEEIKESTINKFNELKLNDKVALIDNLAPIYLPYWMYSGKVEALYNFELKTIEIKNILVDASAKVKDSISDAIEKDFDLTKLKVFDHNIIVGYIAEKYDVEGDSVYQRAINKMQLELNDKTKFNSLVYTDLKINYILLPFYFSQNNEGQLLVNGQSGEMSYNAITLETDRKKSKYIRKIHKVKLAEKMNLVDLLFFISLFGCIISLGISWLVKELLPMMSQIFFIIGGILGIIILIYVKFERFL